MALNSFIPQHQRHACTHMHTCTCMCVHRLIVYPINCHYLTLKEEFLDEKDERELISRHVDHVQYF